MKTNLLRFFIPFLACLGFFSSCQKEKSFDPASEHLPASANQWQDYDRFGPLLENSISLCAADHGFAFQLFSLTQSRPTGDFEALLSDFTSMELPDGSTVKDLIISKSEGKIKGEQLDAFLQQYPSVIVGLRGNPSSWLKEDHLPPVKFVPYAFERQRTKCIALQNGNPVQLDLTRGFEEAVIAIHLSERHDNAGNPLVQQPQATRPGRIQPSISAGDLGNAVPLASCGPEPTECPDPLPVINSFTATPQNGGMLLSYSIANFPTTLCTWGQVRIKRLNPDGSLTEFLRNADDPNNFYDNSGNPNIVYTYTLDVCIFFYNNRADRWENCPATNNFQSVSATYPEAGSLVESFVGSNVSNSVIRYDWYPPNGNPINEYRLRRSTPNGYVTVANLTGSATDYFYTYPSADKGEQVRMQIQYKAAGFWQGNFFDVSYGSFRNPGQTFKYYGLRMDDLSAFDSGESPLFGGPEVRLTALQANASETSIVLEETFFPMTACTQKITQSIVDPFNNTVYTVEIDVATGYYYPTPAPNGYPILNAWDSDLAGSAIRVITKETDFNEPVVTSSSTTVSNETTLNGKVGFKFKEILTAEVGVTSTWKNSSTVNVRYPDGDLPLGDRIIYYHDHPTTVRGKELFGNITFGDNCQNLSDNL